VISAYTPLAISKILKTDAKWTMIVEINANEAFMPLSNLLSLLLLFALIALVIVVMVSFLIAKKIVTIPKAMSRAAEQIALGNFDISIPTLHREDEIGLVGASFQHMIAYLKGIAEIAEQISSGNLDVNVVAQSEKDTLGCNLAKMVNMHREQFEKIQADMDVIKTVVDMTVDVVSGNLDISIDTAVCKRTDIVGELSRSIVQMVKKLSFFISNTLSISKQLSSASEQIAQGNQDLSNRTEQQASSLEETSSAMAEMAESIRMNTEYAEKTNKLATIAHEKSRIGTKATEEVIEAMSVSRLSLDAVMSKNVSSSAPSSL